MVPNNNDNSAPPPLHAQHAMRWFAGGELIKKLSQTAVEFYSIREAIGDSEYKAVFNNRDELLDHLDAISRGFVKVFNAIEVSFGKVPEEPEKPATDEERKARMELVKPDEA